MAKDWDVDAIEPLAATGGWDVAEELPLDAVTKQASVGSEPMANVYDPATGALMIDNGETTRTSRDRRNAQDDPRRLDRKTGAKIADDVAFLSGRREKLKQANAGTSATPDQIEALAQFEMDSRGAPTSYGLQDRVAGYQAKGMSATESTRNAVFDATLEQRLNEPFQKAKPAVTGERISTDYQPEREAERVKKQGDDLASLRDDIIGRNAAGEMNATWRGVTKGGIQSAALTAGTVGYIGDVFGADALKQWGLDKYDRGMKLANQLTLSKNASDIRSADDLGEWLAENAGYVAYQAAEAIITGGAGSAIGKQVGKQALVTAVGLGLNSMRQTLGSVYGEAVETAKATGKPMPSLLQVFGGAAASAAVDALADKIGLDAITAKGFKGNVLSRVGKSVGSQLAVQGGTEAAQLVPEEWGAGRDPFRDGMAKQYFDEAAVGALGGAGPGVMGAIARNPQDQIAAELSRALTTGQVPDEAVRAAAVEQERAKLASMRAGAIADISKAQTVDEAIAAAQTAVNLPTSGPLERMSQRVNDADLLAQALGSAGIEPSTAADVQSVAPVASPAAAPELAAQEPALQAPTTVTPAAAPTVLGRPVADVQTGQLLQIAKSAMFPEPVREVARQEVKRREIEAMYAQRDLPQKTKAAEEQAIVEAVRDEKVEQAEALTSAQTIDAPTAMQLAFQRAQAKQTEAPNVQNPAPAAAAAQAVSSAAPVEAAAPAGADGSAAAGVSQPGATARVEADGVVAPAELGRNNQPISEGGKPFKTRAEVDAAKKLQPLMRVKKVKGGFILTEKTPAQIAAQAKAARRLGGTGVTGAMAAHELLASLGGLSKSTMADLGFDRNVRVGARWLFSGTGGLSLERATEALQQNGYMDGTDQAQGISIIQRSAKGTPQYTSDGWEQIAKAEADARYEDHLAAQQEAAQEEDFDPFASIADDGYVFEDAEAAGLGDAAPEQLTELLAGLDQLETIGQDLDSIAERIALQYPDATQQEYHELVQNAINEAINGSTQPRGDRDDGQAGRGQADATETGSEQDAAEGDLLSSPTRADIEAQQERADAAARQEDADRHRAEQEDVAARDRAEVARRSEAAADTFELGQDPMANLTGQKDIFGASQQEPETVAQPKRVAPRASQPKTETPRLTDAGEELIRNRRGKLKGLAWDDVSSMNDTLKVAQVVKANVWPRPDYAKMVEEGAPAWKAAALKAIYDKLAAAPVTRTTPTDDDLRSYIETIHQIRDLITAELDRVAALPDGAELWKSLKSDNVFGKAFPVPADARPMFGRPSPFDRVSEQGKANNKRALMIGGNATIQALQFNHKMLSKVKDLLAAGFPAKQEAWQKSWEVRATETRDSDVPEAERTGEAQQRFYVYEKGSRWRLAKGVQDGGYATQEQAEAFARSLTARKREVLPPSRGLDLADARRTGPDWRGGKDVTAQDIMDHFGFRGVNLGEYVKAKQNVAQLHLNHVYDAFSDLADLMGVPPAAMSLNGALGVAIGAQGSGKALAHFTPGVNEINITRDAGAGALAHEFGHALDHYFATQHGRAASMAKRPYLSAVVQTLSDPGGVRAEVIEAMRTIMRTINTRPMTEAEARQFLEDQRTRNRKYLDRWVKEFSGNKGADPTALKAVAEKLARGDLGEPVDGDLEANLIEFMRAANLKPGNAIASNPISVAYRLRDLADEDRFLKTHIPQTETNYAKASDALDAKKAGGEGYWSTPWEKFARAFETFAMDALKSRDRESLYLSGLVDGDGWRDWSESTGKAMPFPEGAERLALQQAFQKLVDTIQTKETEQGVMMYARGDSDTDQVNTPEFKRWFGDWQAVSAQKRLDAMVPVKINVPTEWRDLSVGRLREKVGEALDAMIAERSSLQHPEIGTVAIRRRGVKKALHAGADPAKLFVLGDLRNVFERSVFASEQAAQDGGTDVIAYEKLIAKIEVAGQEMAAVFTVQRMADGRQFYNAVTLDDGKSKTPEGSPRTAATKVDSTTTAITGVSGFIRRPLTSVNPDSVSKVVDADGKPLVVYHGTIAEFESFDNSKTGANDRGLWGRGHYFSAMAENANSYALRQGDGARVIPAYVSIKNPLVLKTGSDLVTRLPDGTNYRDLVGPNLDGAKIKDIAISGGHDGVIQIRPNGLIGDVVAFSPEQIKSAIGNRGTFDPENPDIRLAQGFDADMFSRITRPMPTSMAISDVRAAVDELAATWKNAPPIRIVTTPAALPQKNAPANARGAYDGNTVWIVAGNHRSAGQVFKTLAHEAIAHHGLRAILGEQWGKTMQVMQLALKSGNKALGELRDEVRSAYVDERGNFNLTPSQEADEIAARAVEHAIEPVTGEFRTGMGWLKSVYARVATWLREIGIPVTFTNVELQGMLVRAQEYLRAGEKQMFVTSDSMAEGALATDEASLPDGFAANSPVDNAGDYDGESIVNRVNAGLSGGARVIWVKSFGDLPADVQHRAVAAGMANPMGVTVGRGTVYVVQDANPSAAEMESTILHELYGHVGLRTLFGADIYRRLNKLYLALGETKLREIAEKYGLDQNGYFEAADNMAASASERNAQRAGGRESIKQGWLMEEALAHIAQHETGTLRQQALELVGAIRSWLRDSGFVVLSGMDMADIAHILKQARLSISQSADGADTYVDTPAFARGTPSASRFRLDPENWRGKTRRVMQDYFIRVRRVQEAIASQGGLVDESTDTYLAEELSYGRIQESLKDFANKMVKPMIEKAQAAGIDMDELALYAYAKHAQERNAQIARIDPNMPDGGSGMTDAEAAAILAKAGAKKADFESLHADLMAMTATTRQTLWQEGLITEDEFNALDGMYDNYVPLRGFELKDDDGKPSGMRAGKGFNVRGKETMRALGRQSRAGDVIENIIADYERAVVRAERNQVAKVFLNFVLKNPDASLWEVDATRTKKALDRQTGLVARDTAIEKGEDTIAVKVAGREVYIQIHDDMLARAMRNAHKDETGEAERALIKTVGLYATLMRNTLTRFNPEFAVVNTIRDFGFGTAAALDKLGEKGAAKFVKHYAGAYAASARAELGKGDPTTREWDKWFEEYRAAGGTTGGFYTRGAEEIRSDMRDLILAAGATPKGWVEEIKVGKIGVTVNGKKRGFSPYQAVKSAGRILEFAGAASENAARVAAYRAAREMGKSPSESASIAKNLTTNFNRRGEAGQLLNSLFVFYNAAIQGAQRTAAMFKNPKMRGYLAAGTAATVGLALANAIGGGDDEDDGQAYWDKIPDYVKERNLIIMLPPGTEVDGAEKVGTKGRYIAIPVQYGLNIFSVTGYGIADLIRNTVDETRGKNWLQSGSRVASTVFGSFNPFGGGVDNVHSAAMTVMPSILDVVYQYAAGVNGFGRPTSPFKSDYDTSPDSENVNARQSGGISHRVARWVNSVTGGDEAEPGLVDMAPGTIEQTWRNLTGGTGMFIGDVLTIAAKQIDDHFNGGENDYFVRDIPVLRKVYGETDGDVDQSLFYDRRREINEARTVERRKEELGREMTNPRQIALAGMASDGNKFARSLSGIRKEMIEIGKDEEMSDTEKKVRLRELKAERDNLTREFNRLFMDTMRDLRNGDFDVDTND